MFQSPELKHNNLQNLSQLQGSVLTILEDSLHVQAVGGAGLIIRAAFQVIWQLSGPWVVDHSGVGGADRIWGGNKTYYSNMRLR